MASSGHAPLTGRYGATGKNGPLGSTRPIYNNGYMTDEERAYEDELADAELEAIGFPPDVHKKINKKTSPANTAYGVDTRTNPSSNLSLTSPNHGVMEGNGVTQKPWTNTTTARSTISPFSHNQLYPNGTGPIIGTGGSDQAFRTTGNHMSKGTEKGWNKGHSPLTDIDDSNLYDIRDILDPDERSFRKYQYGNSNNILEPIEKSFRRKQKSLKHTLNKINEYLLDN